MNFLELQMNVRETTLHNIWDKSESCNEFGCFSQSENSNYSISSKQCYGWMKFPH
jgi:hypothetical protein